MAQPSPPSPAASAPPSPAPPALSADGLHVAVARAAGLDIHKMQITASVRLCMPGKPQPLSATAEYPTHPQGLAALVAWLRGHGVTAATMESTGVYWYAPYQALQRAGIRAELVHAQHVKQIRGRKTDVQDSLWLARICQLGLARPSYVPPAAFGALRQQCRYRRKVVGDRARVRQRLQKTLDHEGLRLGGVLTDILGANGRRILEGLRQGRSPERILATLTRHVQGKRDELRLALAAPLDAHALWRLECLLDDFDAATERLADLDARTEAALAPYEQQLNLLVTIPGIARVSAHALLVELGPEPARVFGSAAACAAWAGVCPGNNESAGKRRSGRLRPGNPTLRATLAECAHGAARSQGSQFHGFHGALHARLGYKKAILAVTHKLLRVVYAVLRDGKPYRDPGIDYAKLVVDRNAPRWLRDLKRYGWLPQG